MVLNLPLPKYHQIYLVLREQLQEGRFAEGLQAEMVLSKQFGVGRVTVRRALEKLAAEGLIIREAGRGTRPAPTKQSLSAGLPGSQALAALCSIAAMPLICRCEVAERGKSYRVSIS